MITLNTDEIAVFRKIIYVEIISNSEDESIMKLSFDEMRPALQCEGKSSLWMKSPNW